MPGVTWSGRQTEPLLAGTRGAFPKQPAFLKGFRRKVRKNTSRAATLEMVPDSVRYDFRKKDLIAYDRRH